MTEWFTPNNTMTDNNIVFTGEDLFRWRLFFEMLVLVFSDHHLAQLDSNTYFFLFKFITTFFVPFSFLCLFGCVLLLSFYCYHHVNILGKHVMIIMFKLKILFGQGKVYSCYYIHFQTMAEKNQRTEWAQLKTMASFTCEDGKGFVSGTTSLLQNYSS